MAKVLMKGNEAVGKAAIEAGCRYFFGYPITPQSEVPEYLSSELPKVGGVFVQAESEVAAINMVYGAAGAGARVLTSSSSPGIALKQEGIGYISNAGLPAVIINMMRGGPGLGTIQPGQADYNMTVKGGSNGDYHDIVLAPASVQEAVDMVMEAFDLADYYGTPVIVLADGLIGQMMEPVEFNYVCKKELAPKTWALTGKGDGEKHMIQNLVIEPDECEAWNKSHFEKYAVIEANEQAWEEYLMEDAEYAFVSYGTSSRIVRSAISYLREAGYKVGMIRPKTLWPFPAKAFEKLDKKIKKYMDVEMSMGQMVQDVAYACNDKNKIEFYGRTGGVVPAVDEIVEFGKRVMGGDK
ncbi:NADH-dependent phenylglyoxylate dehydrogenase subunit alpha [Anaerotignum neopropionicum]|uniref:NADH-dependent phenylglyoxylate dehydrogenase subunit alpha n=1 Tax=Anaerotignum neopropionicum TaxID=36847 RepID=A0A136WE16_9FIRM|nr:3-methyl-2-oxobutanoate dehydrogenase subunit VorB [Anaerotignum neopropionicum]KXL52758.1 NADH-dependent phenylglyoxylate dehydrogenase subunit alpha [Anaerotignum neopropionicum]